mmetsp:Transcript_568/g.1491  ORF Transcript_568/g.1491 Transcript_568/m.1491 type:complete len:686 (-) Transcript_568:1025-3082(-)
MKKRVISGFLVRNVPVTQSGTEKLARDTQTLPTESTAECSAELQGSAQKRADGSRESVASSADALDDEDAYFDGTGVSAIICSRSEASKKAPIAAPSRAIPSLQRKPSEPRDSKFSALGSSASSVFLSGGNWLYSQRDRKDISGDANPDEASNLALSAARPGPLNATPSAPAETSSQVRQSDDAMRTEPDVNHATAPADFEDSNFRAKNDESCVDASTVPAEPEFESLHLPDAQVDRRRPRPPLRKHSSLTNMSDTMGHAGAATAMRSASEDIISGAKAEVDEVALTPVRESIDVRNTSTLGSNPHQLPTVDPSTADPNIERLEAVRRPRLFSDHRNRTFGFASLRMKSDLTGSKDGSTKGEASSAGAQIGSGRGASFTLGTLGSFMKRSSTDRSIPDIRKSTDLQKFEEQTSADKKTSAGRRSQPLEDIHIEDVVQWESQILDANRGDALSGRNDAGALTQNSSQIGVDSHVSGTDEADTYDHDAPPQAYVMAASGSLIDLDIAGRVSGQNTGGQQTAHATKQTLLAPLNALAPGIGSSASGASPRERTVKSEDRQAAAPITMEDLIVDPRGFNNNASGSSTPLIGGKSKRQNTFGKKFRLPPLFARSNTEDGVPKREMSQIAIASESILDEHGADTPANASTPFEAERKKTLPASFGQTRKWRDRLRPVGGGGGGKRAVSKPE